MRAGAGVAVTAAVSGAALSLTALRGPVNTETLNVHDGDEPSDADEQARDIKNSLERRSSLGSRVGWSLALCGV